MPLPSATLTPAEHDQLTLKSILARFEGNRDLARRYCIDVATEQMCNNKTLANEYWRYAGDLTRKETQ